MSGGGGRTTTRGSFAPQGVVALAALGLVACSGPAPGALDLSDHIVVELGTSDDLGPPVPLPDLPGNTLPLPGNAPVAWLIFDVTDNGQRVPSRVIFRPVPGAGYAEDILMGQPNLTSLPGAIGTVVGPGVVGSVEGVLLAYGAGRVPVPPGTWTLVLTRGPEYELLETTVTVAAGDVRTIAARLDRVIDTTGWIATDLHVHTGRSYDAKLRNERRLISEVTNGVELVVSTDHNVNTDFAPDAASLGYGPELVGTLVGDEFNFSPGHGGAYPVPYDANDPVGGGAIPYTNTCTDPIPGINCSPGPEAFQRIHALSPDTVVTVNHPYWPGGDLGYFTSIGWGSGTANPLPSPLATAGQFEALEILNGYQASTSSLDNLLADWFYLLGQGIHVTGLGSSDTHRLNWVRAGWPRTWLKLPVARPGDTTGALLAEAIRKGRAIASTGPFVELRADGAEIGDTLIPARAGVVQLEVLVDAPSWIHVDTVRVFVNGSEVKRFGVPLGRRPVLAASFDQAIAGDSWVVVQVTGSDPMPPDVVGEYSRYYNYEMTPWAVTNPIWIDADGDGQVRPPPSPYRARPTRLPPAPPLYSPDGRRLAPPAPTLEPDSEPELDAPTRFEQELQPFLTIGRPPASMVPILDAAPAPTRAQ